MAHPHSLRVTAVTDLNTGSFSTFGNYGAETGFFAKGERRAGVYLIPNTGGNTAFGAYFATNNGGLRAPFGWVDAGETQTIDFASSVPDCEEVRFRSYMSSGTVLFEILNSSGAVMGSRTISVPNIDTSYSISVGPLDPDPDPDPDPEPTVFWTALRDAREIP